MKNLKPSALDFATLDELLEEIYKRQTDVIILLYEEEKDTHRIRSNIKSDATLLGYLNYWQMLKVKEIHQTANLRNSNPNDLGN